MYNESKKIAGIYTRTFVEIIDVGMLFEVSHGRYDNCKIVLGALRCYDLSLFQGGFSHTKKDMVWAIFVMPTPDPWPKEG
jgi:hypothetical protein